MRARSQPCLVANSRVASGALRAGASNKSDIGGVLQVNHIHIKVAELGAVSATLAALRVSEATQNKRNKVRFIAEHGRAPLHGEDRDIFERLYAVRLDRLQYCAACRAVLEQLDQQGLLNHVSQSSSSVPPRRKHHRRFVRP